MKELTKRGITSTILGLFTWISLDYLSPIVFFTFLVGVLLEVMVCEWPRFFNVKTPFFWIITPFYPLLPFALLLALSIHPNPAYQQLLFIMFVLVSSHDTGSFMVGSMYGKHRMAPRVSPSKTWEGFFGGCVTSLITMAFIIITRAQPHGPWLTLIAITLFTCVIALLGDLFESFLKRRANLKDSGTVLPGHGGFLDRFDGILFAVIFFYIFKESLCLLFGA